MNTQDQKEYLHAVIRFKRDCNFPRFSMKAGERWGFCLGGANREKLEAIKAGRRFDFAGGQCLAEDVDIVYEGPSNLAYSIAAGYVTNPDVIKSYRENPERFERMAGDRASSDEVAVGDKRAVARKPKNSSLGM